MIISASRRTDIPAYYSEWFINRLKEGYVLSRNPMNHSQVSKVILSPDLIDCIVFWTKDPFPMMDRLDFLDKNHYQYYFQFTLTPYDRTIEKGLRDKKEIIKTFCLLSERIGKEKVLWRYDPVIINDQLDISYHREQFSSMCRLLSKATNQCTISFVDLYSKLKTDLIRKISEDTMIELAQMIFDIAKEHGILVKACCESLPLDGIGVKKASCIDGKLIERIIGRPLAVKKDKNQRPLCGCHESVDIGVYNTCKNGCVYCYANYSSSSVEKNCKSHDPYSELLTGVITDKDHITVRNG